ncbi:MAG: mechanosensitive ion channel family protein [Clostridiaceae bacterium]
MDNLIGFFQKYSNFEEKLYNLADSGLKILVILVLMYLSVKIGNSFIRRIIDKHQRFKFSLSEKKSQTLKLLLQSILRYAVYFVGIISIVEVMFGTIGLTLAGIGGIAVGFGSQSLIKDVINGFFILFEDQYSVGDFITIDGKGGTVESIGLRLTKIRDFNGDLHTIPNGAITKVTNHSRGNARIQVEAEISYNTDLDKATEALNSLCRRFCEENEDVVECPQVIGLSALKDTGITVRVVGMTTPAAQFMLEMKLRREIMDTLLEEGIEMPFQKAKLIKE